MNAKTAAALTKAARHDSWRVLSDKAAERLERLGLFDTERWCLTSAGSHALDDIEWERRPR